LSGADVGGFAGSPSADLLTKWVELAAFQPIDRIHSAKGTRMHEVWVDGPEHEAIRRRFIEERYRLMPYIYTTAEETSRDGLPIDRPLFLEYPSDFTGGTEFMVGSRIVIAPSAHMEDKVAYAVHLPPGTWYDYWSGEKVQAGEAGPVDLEQRDKVVAQKPLMVAPKLDQLPVYVRGGSILPIAPLTQSTSETPNGPLTLRVFPLIAGVGSRGEACAGEVYTDDGHTLNFKQGEFARIHFSCAVAADGSVTVQIGSQEGTWKPWWREYRVEVVGFTPKTSEATMNSQRLTLSQVDGRWGVVIPALASGSIIKLK
jgi:alpha-glucosidase